MTEERSARHGGLSLKTLGISSASAVVTATVVPMFWEKGTVLATAITPIVTAIAAEAMSRPVERISTVGVWRRTPTGTAIREGAAPEEVVEPDEERLVVPPAPADEEKPRRLNPRLVRIGIITGLLGFLIAAALVTASELAIFDKSVGGKDRTSLFGGHVDQATPTPTAAPAATVTPTATPSATASPTATPTPTVTATATATPAETPVPTVSAIPTPTP
jgi:hypothetical protein